MSHDDGIGLAFAVHLILFAFFCAQNFFIVPWKFPMYPVSGLLSGLLSGLR